jgi:hypothetical protein
MIDFYLCRVSFWLQIYIVVITLQYSSKCLTPPGTQRMFLCIDKKVELKILNYNLTLFVIEPTGTRETWQMYPQACIY